MAMAGMRRNATGRRVVADLALTTAGAAALAQVVHGPPGSGYGWGSVVVSAIVVAAPLVVLGLAVRAADPRVAWVTMALAAGLTAFVLLALLGNWSGQSLIDNALDCVVALLVLATGAGTWVEELSLLRRVRHS